MNNFSNYKSKHVNIEWNNAIRELESAQSMFNYAVSEEHIKIACQLLTLAEQKISTLRKSSEEKLSTLKLIQIQKKETMSQLEILNNEPMPIIEKDTLIRKVIKKVLGVVYDVE